MTLFRGVKILAINRLFNVSGVQGGGENSVTLELSEGQANIILVARDKGTLYFSYNPEGQGNGALAVMGKDRVTLEEILGLDPIPKPAPPPAPVISQIYRGLTMKQYTYTKVGSKMLQAGTAVIGGTSSQSVPANTGNNSANPGQGQQPVQPPGAGYRCRFGARWIRHLRASRTTSKASRRRCRRNDRFDRLPPEDSLPRRSIPDAGLNRLREGSVCSPGVDAGIEWPGLD